MQKHKDMIIMSTNGKEEKVIKYTNDYEIIQELNLEEDFGFQLVRFTNQIYGINYINPTENINETIMVSVDKEVDAGPVAFLKYAEEAYHLERFHEIESVELVINVDPKNREIYRETINSDEAKTLLEKLEISRELVELERENNFWYKHGSTVIIIIAMINIIIVVINIIRLNGGNIV